MDNSQVQDLEQFIDTSISQSKQTMFDDFKQFLDDRISKLAATII